jgi:ATP-binding cassette subfamily C (CFTR/MRP) protein 1
LKQQTYFTKTYRELKRIDSVSRSPLYALLGETLDGISTIRAFRAEPTLMKRLSTSLDLQQNAYFLTTTAQCWLAIRLEMVGTFIIFSACICAVLQHGSQSSSDTFAGLAGLSISFALSVTQSLNWSVRMSSDLEAQMVSVERIQQYCRIPSEAPHNQPIDNTMGSWPSRGEIIFSSVQLRYRQNLPLILKDINLRFPAGSKIGIVGRTGAGKSTIALSLLRLVELSSGKIEIDGFDISRVGLKRLRSSIAVIPQSPVLFSGTIRTNLDPFNEYLDERIQDVLQRVGLLSFEKKNSSQSLLVSTTSFSRLGNSAVVKSMHDEVHEGGSNLSVGQRQLLVIARSMLQGCKVVIMDEATASVDPDTDAKIQRVLRTEFQSSTCITVAHRLNTIMDSDYILVMDNGKAVEFDSPSNLIREGGLFKDLVDSWGKESTKSKHTS